MPSSSASTRDFGRSCVLPKCSVSDVDATFQETVPSVSTTPTTHNNCRVSMAGFCKAASSKFLRPAACVSASTSYNVLFPSLDAGDGLAQDLKPGSAQPPPPWNDKSCHARPGPAGEQTVQVPGVVVQPFTPLQASCDGRQSPPSIAETGATGHQPSSGSTPISSSVLIGGPPDHDSVDARVSPAPLPRSSRPPLMMIGQTQGELVSGHGQALRRAAGSNDCP